MEDVTIESLTYEELPPNIREHFENKSQLYIPPEEYKPKNFEFFEKITFPNQDTVYVASQQKTYMFGYPKYRQEEINVHFFEINKESKYIGHGEIRYAKWSTEAYFEKKPFVGYTSTEGEIWNQGYGYRRLLLFNDFTQRHYGLQLYSSTTIGDEAVSVWKKAVRLGLAKEIKTEKDNTRYCFKLLKPN